ncbi:ASKHA domain-containing protein [Peptostreptococcus sp. D1]|uniref:ASKHA domain-containing protein n=1 Tax=Peptostreptococcus sp. D1 TaxID=72304 RepID=UPI0008EBC8C6|nr:ASKHA domain-containing protein [Peptostreptococcus sp. D1]SFE58129.1 Uroporphyrinogen decarboxylase (URO-D) [Peptostreptococcus sp. D1]
MSAYIGAAIVSGAYACNLENRKGNILFIDIGTNGEIVLSKSGQLLCCFCAAGTALDGMNISSGMRAVDGAIKEYDDATFCELPFCHTVEAEAMGGIVNYGDEKSGPRAKEYICTKPEEILELKEIDFNSGRIFEVLEACKILGEQGEDVVLEVAGPFTIMNVLIVPVYVFKALFLYKRKVFHLLSRTNII